MKNPFACSNYLNADGKFDLRLVPFDLHGNPINSDSIFWNDEDECYEIDGTDLEVNILYHYYDHVVNEQFWIWKDSNNVVNIDV